MMYTIYIKYKKFSPTSYLAFKLIVMCSGSYRGNEVFRLNMGFRMISNRIFPFTFGIFRHLKFTIVVTIYDFTIFFLIAVYIYNVFFFYSICHSLFCIFSSMYNALGISNFRIIIKKFSNMLLF